MAIEKQLEDIRHSLAHLLAVAVLKEFPKAKLGIGPTIEDGFYYDFDLPRTLTPDDLKKFEKTMRHLIKQNLPFSGKKLTPAEARKIFKDQPFKLDLIKEFSAEKKQLTLYETGDIFFDLCRGGHAKNTKEINADAFKLTKIAGAYWRGDEKNPQLQRVYGIAFKTKKALDEHVALFEEAKKRDHRKLGKALRLYTMTDEIGPGLPLFYPKGARLRRTIENFITEVQERRGYEPIWIPHITKSDLYKISGHLDKFDALYPPMKLKGEGEYYLKPMNCPHFMMLYKSEQHSYKELPIRYTATTTNYRYEKSGELSGLTRVRALTQDDCHVFVTPEQIEPEINRMLDMIEEVYMAFGLTNFWVRISTRDKDKKQNYIGDEKIWRRSEATLTKLVKARGWKHELGPGEATFYGPKIDFIFRDVLGREWQLSTIQLDMNLPKRFKLEYIDEKGQKKEPIVLHRAILGSTERFLGILIEHFGGAFPLWLAPVQVSVIPISEKFANYAKKIKDELVFAKVRVELDQSNETLGKRIRGAELQKIPYILIVGEKEQKGETVNVRHYKRGQPSSAKAMAGMDGEVPLKKLLNKISDEIEKKII